MAERIGRTDRPFNIRLSNDDRLRLDNLAINLQVDRSDVIRTLIRSARITAPSIDVALEKFREV